MALDELQDYFISQGWERFAPTGPNTTVDGFTASGVNDASINDMSIGVEC